MNSLCQGGPFPIYKHASIIVKVKKERKKRKEKRKPALLPYGEWDRKLTFLSLCPKQLKDKRKLKDKTKVKEKKKKNKVNICKKLKANNTSIVIKIVINEQRGCMYEYNHVQSEKNEWKLIWRLLFCDRLKFVTAALVRSQIGSNCRSTNFRLPVFKLKLNISLKLRWIYKNITDIDYHTCVFLHIK